MQNPSEQSSKPETLLASMVARLDLRPRLSEVAGDSLDGWLVGRDGRLV